MNPVITCKHCDFKEICRIFAVEPARINQLKQLKTVVIHLNKGNILYADNAPFISIYSVRSGTLKSTGPNDKIIQFHMQGDVFGFDGIEKNRHTLSCHAITDAIVCAFDFQVLMSALSQDRKKNDHFIRILSRTLNQQSRQLGQNKTAEQKLAEFLLYISERQSTYGFSPTNFTLAMKRAEIANYLNLTVETISRLLHHLMNKKIIFVQNKTIKILAPERLRQIGAK